MTRREAISRRQFLTGAFRRRDVATPGKAAISAARRDLAARKLDERDRPVWNQERQSDLAFAAPETAPHIPDWDSGIDRALEELENLKGIEDF